MTLKSSGNELLEKESSKIKRKKKKKLRACLCDHGANYHLPKRPSAISASECIVVRWRLSPTVPEKMLKLSSSEVVSKTASSSIAIPNSSKKCMFSLFSFIIQIAISITNRRICGVLVGGFLCFFRI